MKILSLTIIISALLVFLILRPIYLKDIVDYEYKSLADILAFIFLTWIVSVFIGLFVAMFM